MTWRDELRRVTLTDGRQLIGASFRGVPFFVESADRSGGRRIVVHEFPLREDPYVEDLGRRARSFRVDGYVLGADYVAARDALLAALEDTSGPGELVHPYYGVKRAICAGMSVRESIVDGGIAIFSIEFQETPAQAAAPTEETDLPAQVASSATAAVAATQAEFSEAFDVDGLPAFALESAARALAAAAEELGARLAPAVRSAQELAALDSSIHGLTTQAGALVRQPGEVLGALQGALTGLADTAANSPGALLEGLLAAYGVDLGPDVLETTTTRIRERANQVAITSALRRLIVIEAARLAPLVPYASIEEATAARDAVAGKLEEQAAIAEDTAYPALVQLRADVVRAVPGDATFARVISISRPVALPSLLVAYQLYGSVELEADVVARNGARHPGFLAGTLKVLSNG